VKLQFDPNQQFQLDAVKAIADLFEGQPEGPPEYAPIDLGGYEGLFAGQESTELGIGNRLILNEDSLHQNARVIQLENEIDVANPDLALEAWELFDGPANTARRCPHFSVEMETGTGKTYVYLRTIFELSKRYGFKKFVIVVPSVAIREGVLKNIEITAEHFKALYNEEPRYFLYDARRLSRIREFATANTLQVQIINIQAFVKNFTGTDAGKLSNVIYKESDKLSGRQPIEFVQAARPIVIIDEPQSVDSTEKSQEAIKALNPLITLRYSATHRNPYNLMYRLDPIRAFELKLVKQIVVASASVDGAVGDAYVKVEEITLDRGITAKLRILQHQPQSGPKYKSVRVKSGADLHLLSNEKAEYASGYAVAEISAEPGREFVLLANGRRLRIGQELGGVRDDIWQAQIKHTVKRHLDTEVALAERGIKVLSLFFIDRVANYRRYDGEGMPAKGKFAEAFEAELSALATDPAYASLAWLKQPIEKLHDGYFAQDKKGVLKDTRGDTQLDDDAYNLIMKDKERLLSIDVPLRFIFSHSALREGWDNPNVFQICTLNETASVVKKRQEIGRGLRLPVNQDGQRVFDDSVNRLYVMANESYEDFAKALQTEYEEDTGVTFGKIPLTALAKVLRVVDDHQERIGREAAIEIRDALITQGLLDEEGRLLPAFDPRKPGFSIQLPPAHAELALAVTDLLASYQIERHIRRLTDEGKNRLKREVVLTPEFEELWKRIRPRTTYRVEFDTNELVTLANVAIRGMPKVEKPEIRVSTGSVRVTRGGVTGSAISEATEDIDYSARPLPDVLTYLQNETDLTRSTLLRILKESGRLAEFFKDPQRFMDQVASTIRYVMHRLLVDGIKYERLGPDQPNAEWEMREFKDEELVNYLTSVHVDKSVYEYVVYESEVEREFARRLDQREDIKLFVKLPGWFKIETPVGEYNPDWAIVKEDGQTLYLARETKGTKDVLKLRTTEADKIRCGKAHFDSLGVSFDVVVTADQV
jgi:type III restriction enzyme